MKLVASRCFYFGRFSKRILWIRPHGNLPISTTAFSKLSMLSLNKIRGSKAEEVFVVWRRSMRSFLKTGCCPVIGRRLPVGARRGVCPGCGFVATWQFSARAVCVNTPPSASAWNV